jgi:hypothetical protein
MIYLIYQVEGVVEMLKKLIKLVQKRNAKIDTICTDWDIINQKIISQSLDKR